MEQALGAAVAERRRTDPTVIQSRLCSVATVGGTQQQVAHRRQNTRPKFVV